MKPIYNYINVYLIIYGRKTNYDYYVNDIG